MTDRRHESTVDRIRAEAERKKARRAAPKQVPPPGADPDRPPPGAPSAQALPGIHAAGPTSIPLHGWKQILLRAWAENNADNMPIIAGGVAFFGFLAIFPTLIAMISLYGLIASPSTVAAQVQKISAALPSSAAGLITEQLQSITARTGGALTISLVVSILIALWSASGGVGHLILAVNIAYDEVETRGFVRRKLLALALTLGAIVFVLLVLGLIAVVPVVLDRLPLGSAGTVLAQIVRWVVLLAVMAGSLALIYRIAPDREAPKLRWVSLGSGVVTVAWAAVSVLFSFYVDNFGSYDDTYGALAGVIVLMLWLYLSCYLVLLGAEINAEAEHQTARDTTEGEPMPMGERDAVVADTFPDPPEPGQDGDGARVARHDRGSSGA